jgi:hypothetical protein
LDLVAWGGVEPGKLGLSNENLGFKQCNIMSLLFFFAGLINEEPEVWGF